MLTLAVRLQNRCQPSCLWPARQASYCCHGSCIASTLCFFCLQQVTNSCQSPSPSYQAYSPVPPVSLSCLFVCGLLCFVCFLPCPCVPPPSVSLLRHNRRHYRLFFFFPVNKHNNNNLSSLSLLSTLSFHTLCLFFSLCRILITSPLSLHSFVLVLLLLFLPISPPPHPKLIRLTVLVLNTSSLTTYF